ncbi:hypothetical protein E2562_011430 [Oryza meyeriana var. granulata]|uniref:Uncharacterized protein n=1 Tax=Oryza meyeriana var. granulata TaxID=110450 RepID=A0A6G1D263_9ORYZ|nr:hypothetical protein E2562_011430 [Oryza meyeriana var. granulata]
MVPLAVAVVARTLLCVPAMALAPQEMAAEVAAATALGADVAELRLDRLSGFVPHRDLPVRPPCPAAPAFGHRHLQLPIRKAS